MADSMSGLSEQEAEEFHKYYMQGLVLFVVVAVVAHFLTWIWRPWFHDGQTAALEGLNTVASTLTTLIG